MREQKHMMDSPIVQKDKTFLWHPFTQQLGWEEEPQLAITEGEGVYLIDEAGKKYYDGVSSLWVNIHGHRRPEIDRAIRDQLDKIAHSTLLGLVSPPSVELAEKLVEITPAGLDRVFLSDDGSTAIEVALKMAFQYWQHVGKPEKQKFISMASAYHGDTLGTVSVGGIDLFHEVFRPLLFHPIHLPTPGQYRDAEERERILQESLALLEKTLQEDHDRIAGLIIEPLVQAAAGMLMMPAGYLRRVRELTAEYDVLLIVDEVATGFGRTGKMFACEHEDVSPDFMTLSKGITGGYLPLAATLTTQKIYDAFLGRYDEGKTFYHGHSYTGNALACAAALANIEIFAKDRVIEGLGAKIEAGQEVMARIGAHPHVKEARQCGLIFGIELIADKSTMTPYPVAAAMGARIGRKAREYGLMMRPIGDVLILMPPLASTADQVRDMLEILYRALEEVTSESAEADFEPTVL